MDRKETCTNVSKRKKLLSAAMELTPVNTAADLINMTFQLDCYELCYPVKNGRDLGEHVALYQEDSNPNALAYMDLEKLGRNFRTSKAGLFTGEAYVYSNGLTSKPVYNGTNLSNLKDNFYSIKIRLSSASHAEGVWLRFSGLRRSETWKAG